MKAIFLLIFATSLINDAESRNFSNIPKNCELKNMNGKTDSSYDYRLVSCILKQNSRLEFNRSDYPLQFDEKSKHVEFLFKPVQFKPNIIINRENIDIKSLIQYINNTMMSISIEFRSFKSFDLDLFDITGMSKQRSLMALKCMNCDLNFYLGERKLEKCEDIYIKTKNLTEFLPKSIFQLSWLMLKDKSTIHLFLNEYKSDLCPLVFRNVYVDNLFIYGDNSFYSRRILRFSNTEASFYPPLKSRIFFVTTNIDNIEIDLAFLNPSVFEKIEALDIRGKVKSIEPMLFDSLKNVFLVSLLTEYLKALMHNKQGIEWIRSINRDLNVNLTDMKQIKEHFFDIKRLYFDCNNPAITPHVSDVFPDEDFCLYRDFPFNQLVFLVQTCPKASEFDYFRKGLSCTYLWLIQYYRVYYLILNEKFAFKSHVKFLVNSEEFKSMSKCNFSKRIEICNRSSYGIKPVLTYFEIGETILMMETVINIVSYPLALFGIVTNLFVVITISNRKNREDFKGIKQYSYLRINSICNCLILIIHFLTWINDCFYPYQVFCSEARKTLFLQYVKVFLVQVFGTSLRFMNNFTYISFAFNRISLIGKDHNRLVKFMSEVGTKKYTFVCFLLSLGLSVVKFFSYRINFGDVEFSYPLEYDYVSTKKKTISPIYFVFNLLSDTLNYVVFLLVHMSIDIGMVVKLRQTLNEKWEKSKAYSSKDQIEKKKLENENVINKVTLMVILNTAIGVLFKMPSLIYSIIGFYYSIYRLDQSVLFSHPDFGRFFIRFCSDAYFCRMFLHLANLLYMISISTQFIFFIHFDKKFKNAFNRNFS